LAPVANLPKPAGSKTVQFTKVVNGLTAATKQTSVALGLLCITDRRLDHSKRDLTKVGFREDFRTFFSDIVSEELTNAGYAVLRDKGDLASAAIQQEADYFIGAKLVTSKRHVCLFGTTKKGKALYEIEWSILDRKTEKIVYKSNKAGAGELKEFDSNGKDIITKRTITSVTRMLLADPKFAEVFNGRHTGRRIPKDDASTGRAPLQRPPKKPPVVAQPKVEKSKTVSAPDEFIALKGPQIERLLANLEDVSFPDDDTGQFSSDPWFMSFEGNGKWRADNTAALFESFGSWRVDGDIACISVKDSYGYGASNPIAGCFTVLVNQSRSVVAAKFTDRNSKLFILKDGANGDIARIHGDIARLQPPATTSPTALVTANMQYERGLQHYEGKDLQQDYVEAMKWYRKAADRGLAVAQRKLGQMYDAGVGVLQDYIRAHMWYNLAATNGDEIARKIRVAITNKMTPDQVAEAQKLARQWRPK